ncbi:MAG: elongation factor Ts [Ktedonobacteraceae bacterium]
MNYVAADVKKLRDETGATFADCKNALTEAGSWGEAIKIVDAKRDKKAEKMVTADRETKQGGVFSYVHHNHSVGVLLELNCSTDFVARSETFRKLASELTIQIAGVSTTQYVKLEEVPADVLEAERKAILEDPAIARVPEARRDDFINGKLKKALGDRVLMLQPWVKDEAVSVEELVRKVIAETGENIVLRRFSRFALGG